MATTPDQIEEALVTGREKFLSFVRNKVSDPELAEDLLQDCLLKAVRSAPSLRDGEALMPWFYRILNNAIIDAYRQKATTPASVDIAAAGELEDQPSDHATVCECFRAVLPAMRTDYADLIERLDLNDGSTESEAQRLGITVGNLKVRRHRARQALRRELEATCRVCAEHHCLDCTCK